MKFALLETSSSYPCAVFVEDPPANAGQPTCTLWLDTLKTDGEIRFVQVDVDGCVAL